MKSKITKEELEAIKIYKEKKHLMIQQLFMEPIESDIFLLQHEEEAKYSKEIIQENLQLIEKIFKIIVKNFYQKPVKKGCVLYQSALPAEVDRMKSEDTINHFWIATSNSKKAEELLPKNWSRGIIVQTEIKERVPFVELDKEEILVAPFTYITSREEIENSEEEPYAKLYKIVLEAQELETLSEAEKNELYNSILNRVNQVQEKLAACVELENENTVHYEEIRKLQQLLANNYFTMEQENYEQDTTEAEKQSDLDDIARLNLELTNLKDRLAKTFEIKKENATFIEEWKSDVITYLKNEFRQIQDEYRNQKNKTKEEKAEVQETENIEKMVPEKDLEEPVATVKAEAMENIAVVETLLKNIQNLITRQQNHARIAESMDSNYKALNNAFEMRNFAEELDALLHTIANKINGLFAKDSEELEKISEVNLQVSILLNYLNNAKAAVSKKITRFDEMNIIEENELKKEIAETIKNIRCEAELKKLRDDIEIIEDKSNFRKFLGKFTGRNKLDQTMLDQIQIRQTAIRKTFKTKMPISYNYSIHELIAEIEMFIKENEEDELVTEDVSHLKKIKDILKRNFVIIDSKVISIIDQKTGKNLPLASRKINKKELIEIDTYRFLNRYGYDKSNDVEDPEYQDTMASEIKRIVDYIKTSGIL